MNIYILYALLLCIKQFSAYPENHVCDFTKEENLIKHSNNKICEINAKPFDILTFICPKHAGTKCFHSVSLYNDTKNLNRSVISINTILYGSIAYENNLIVSPAVIKNQTFHCFCDLQTDEENKVLPVEVKEEKKEKGKEEKEKKEEEEQIIEEEEQINENDQRALDKVNKLVNNIQKKNEQQQQDNEEVVLEEPQLVVKKSTHKYGIMKVVVSKNSYKISGCDFGVAFSDHFTKPFPLEKHNGGRVCRIEAKPGDFVGFKCIYDTHGSTEPNNCFDNVFYNNTSTNLKDIMPGYISYGSTENNYYAYYLQLPHFIQSDYTIQCKCRSTQHEFDNYIFELNVKGGESGIIKKSFRS
ncbi:6-cysteine protein, putative [Plasmodium relictum]|uniref:6-cysteine protein, putative n=1 Tax=Plasmodium relictum TaxID=85471 RepID=A0A1J1H0U7_PLARL|nr:6-cysteine protein, putative [Plasmodium relictum]CRG98537.1 6-cysteine protein, putative [Plasmodium relictum]